MRVLILSPYPKRIAETVAKAGDEVCTSIDPLPENPDADYIISYGYRHIIREPLLTAFKGRIVNLHISFLPWNRGADPNFWCWWDDTPKGVTLHEIDQGIDTGPIIAQRHVRFTDDDTLASSWEKLRADVEALFAEQWPSIRNGYSTSPQPFDKPTHKMKDKTAFFYQLSNSYHTPVLEVRERGRIHRKLSNQTEEVA